MLRMFSFYIKSAAGMILLWTSRDIFTGL